MNTPRRHPLRMRTAAALVVATLLAGCASTDYHYSQLVGRRYFKTNIDTYPVIILSVDGRSFVGPYPVLVDAGMRDVQLQGPPTVVNLQLTQVMKLDVKPCTRYYLVAVKQNPLQNEFTPRVDFGEPVAGCTPAPAK